MQQWVQSQKLVALSKYKPISIAGHDMLEEHGLYMVAQLATARAVAVNPLRRTARAALYLRQ